MYTLTYRENKNHYSHFNPLLLHKLPKVYMNSEDSTAVPHFQKIKLHFKQLFLNNIFVFGVK